MSKLLTVTPSPHVHQGDSVEKIMYGVVIALLPALAWSFFMFGLPAVLLTVVSVATCLIAEFLIQKYLLKTEPTITDGSALITGILLAMNVPASLPLWMIAIGAVVAIGIAKMSFGGLGNNPFNPALVGRIFMLISFPVQMTTWPVLHAVDGASGATPLGLIKEGLKMGKPIAELTSQIPTVSQLFMGQVSGSLGEISALFLLIGFAYMLFRKIITWHIPVAVIGSIFIFSGILHMVDPSQYISPVYHILTGGAMLGAIFMATDMVTSPMSKSGQLIFGAGIGIITVLIRVWGAYPEGISFAILIMNAFTPLINIYIKPKRFGGTK
jgi:Na+-translocating ferredoxin:NAD+ oxidoreductase subunit D